MDPTLVLGRHKELTDLDFASLMRHWMVGQFGGGRARTGQPSAGSDDNCVVFCISTITSV